MSQSEVLERIEAKMDALMKDIRERVDSLEGRINLTTTCLTIDEAAARLNVSPSTVKRMVASGEVLTSTVNKRELIPLTELQRIATPNAQRPAQQKAIAKAAWKPLEKKRAR